MAGIAFEDSNFRRGEFKQLQDKYGSNINEIVNKVNNGVFVFDKELADYIYSINTDPKLVISINGLDAPMRMVLTNKNRGRQPNSAYPNEDVHSARVAYTDTDNWFVFGNITVSRDRYTGKSRLINDQYNFEMRKWQGLGVIRNIETIVGSLRYGGVGYFIKYNREIKIEE